MLCVNAGEQIREPLKIVLLGSWRYVEILGCAHEPVYADRHPSDDNELDLCADQREQQVIGFEHRPVFPPSAQL